jgi:hypothetical protein
MKTVLYKKQFAAVVQKTTDGPKEGQRSLKMNRSMIAVTLTVALSVLPGLGSVTLGATPLPYATGFESSDSFAPGSVNGQGGWSADGSSVESVTTAAAHTGTQSLLVAPTAGDGNVVKSSTPIFDPSGETPSVYVPTPASNFMATDFWFRTVALTADTGLYVSTSMGNPASVRNTWLGVLEGSEATAIGGTGATAGNLYVGAVDFDALGNELVSSLSPALSWGQWYHARISEQYVNGPNNDLVTYSIADAADAPVWSVTIGSWENYYATDNTAEQAPGPVVSDRTSFGGSAADGGQGIYVDDFSMTNVVPEPTTISLLAMALGGLMFIRKRK